MTNERPWEQVSLPPALTGMKSMLSSDEMQYLTWLASGKYEGWGAIVELGVWLGSSTAALAEGLRRRGAPATIHSFDLFVWESYMAEAAFTDLKPGDDFLPLFLKQIGDYSSWVEAHKVDLLNYKWDGGPIEILFVDSAKTWDLANAILKGFGAHLSPGRSRVVLQDFRYGYAYCLPLIFDSRPDLWKQIEDVRFGPTVTFVPLKPLFGASGIEADYSEESFPLSVAGPLLRSRIAREEPPSRRQLLQGLYRKYLIDGPLDEARALRAEVLALGIDESDLRTLENIDIVLQPRGWAAYQAGDYQAARAIAERSVSLSTDKSIYALILLGFSCLRLGDREGAERAMEEARHLNPEHPPVMLFRVETAVGDGLYEQAEAEALKVLKTGPLDESTIQWALNLLSRVWQLRENRESSSATLAELAPYLGKSPSYAALLERENTSHIDGCYRIAATHIVPWLATRFDLSEMTAVEVGSGTGGSTLAFAKAMRSVHCFEIHEPSIAVARARLGFRDIDNVCLHSGLFDETCALVRSGCVVDAVILNATLQHMTAEECLSILTLSWRVLRAGGFLAVAGTPNRFSLVDTQTSHLPPFSQLPKEIQVLYAAKSPREDSRGEIGQARREGPGEALETTTLWGSGISFHEFELAIGDDFHKAIVLDGYENDITACCPVSPAETAIERLFSEFGINVHRAFTRSSMFFVAQKPEKT
jgi:predicted O-methyltransferase YrrM/Flp pilus assembly protein TadD